MDQWRDEILNRYEVLTPDEKVQDDFIKRAAAAGDEDARKYLEFVDACSARSSR